MSLPPQTDVRIAERLTVTAPIGVRFWDVAAREFVRSGMHVIAYDAIDPRLSWRALENGSGVSVLRDLRGLRTLEQSDGSPEAWATATLPANERAFRLEVRDPRFRFLPFTCLTTAPQRLFADWMCPVSPPASHREPGGPAQSFPVFPTPERPIPGGYAVVRAQLLEPEASPPLSPPSGTSPRFAAWAYVEVWADAFDSPPPHPRPLGASYADDQGRVAVMFPWPAPAHASLLSPPSPPASGGGLRAQRWSLRLDAYYDGLNPAALPDLCAVLSQRRAVLWDRPGVPLTSRELEYGRELVVRSEDAVGARLSEVLITPGP